MARISTVKPSFFRHRDLFLLEHSSGFPLRVAFAGLWTVADRDGRFRWQPDELKLDCLPYDDVAFGSVLDALERGGFVRRYAVAGKDYGFIPSWAEHQVIGNREAQSVLPDPGVMCSTVDTVITGSVQGEREGKGREGNRKGKGDSSEALTRSEPACALVTTGPVVMVFPTIGTAGDSWRLRQTQVDEWQGAYPPLDVLAECRKALSWVNANPGRRKTPRGMPKFLNGWLSRAVDSGRGTVAPTRSMTAPQPGVTASDWRAECAELHGGRCTKRWDHESLKREAS
jgi:hypothetical protein